MIEIRRVVSKADRRAFIDLPRQIYAGDRFWVPPLRKRQERRLDPRRGLFFRRGEAALFIAERDGNPVGRISAQIDTRHDEIHGRDKGFFGFFECREDPEVSRALFQAAETWLSNRGRNVIEGPYTFTVHDEFGILIDGFDSVPYIMTVHNPPYYRALIEAAGYEKAIDWYAFRATRRMIEDGWPDRLTGLCERIMEREEFELQPFDLGRLERETRRVREIFDAAWSQSRGHVPLGDAETRELADQLRHVVIPELSLFALVEGDPVGLVLSVQDPNPALLRCGGSLLPFGWLRVWRQLRRPARFRVMLLGVLGPFRGRGYEIAMYAQLTRTGMQLGYPESELSVVAEDNHAMIKAISRIPCERYKTFRVFEKRLATVREPGRGHSGERIEASG